MHGKATLISELSGVMGYALPKRFIDTYVMELNIVDPTVVRPHVTHNMHFVPTLIIISYEMI